MTLKSFENAYRIRKQRERRASALSLRHHEGAEPNARHALPVLSDDLAVATTAE